MPQLTANTGFLGRSLTVFGFNDVYDLDPFPGQQRGGVARVATLAAGRDPAKSLLLFGGDACGSGALSPLFRGSQMIEAFNRMGVDAAVPGNHEFDYGPEVATKRFSESRFPWLAANLVWRPDGSNVPGTSPYVLFERDGVRVGVLGLIGDWLGETNGGPDILCVDPIAKAKEVCAKLKEAGAEVIIALTHMQEEEDRELASKVPEINLIVGGHDHKTIADVSAHLMKAGCDGLGLGRAAITLSTEVFVSDGPQVFATENVIEHPEIRAIADTAIATYREKFGEVLAVSNDSLNVPHEVLRTGEARLASLVTDIYRAYAENELRRLGYDFGVDLALTNSGAIRSQQAAIEAGPVTLGQAMALFPSAKELVACRVTGAQLLLALEHGVSEVQNRAGRFLHASGMNYVFDASRPVGSRVVSVTINGTAIDPNKAYVVAMEDFLHSGGDGFEMLKGTPRVMKERLPDTIDIFIAFLKASQRITLPPIEGRVTRLDGE